MNLWNMYIDTLKRRAANCRTVSNLDTTRPHDAHDLQIEAFALDWAARYFEEIFAAQIDAAKHVESKW